MHFIYIIFLQCIKLQIHLTFETNLCRHNFSTVLIKRFFVIIVFLIKLTYNWSLFRNLVLLFLMTNSSFILIYEPIILLITYYKTVYGLATGQQFPPGTSVSFTNKTDRHDNSNPYLNKYKCLNVTPIITVIDLVVLYSLAKIYIKMPHSWPNQYQNILNASSTVLSVYLKGIQRLSLLITMGKICKF